MPRWSVDIPGLGGFDTVQASSALSGFGWRIQAVQNGFTLPVVRLDFSTTPTPGSLVGFTGGTIDPTSTVIGAGIVTTLYLPINGSITAATAVPELSTWAMMLLGFAGLGFAFKQSRRKVAIA